MPWNGSGTFTRAYDWSADRDAGGTSAIIDADKMDAEFDNYKSGLEQCLTRDGQNNPSADLPMNGNKHTGVGNADARNQYAVVGQIQDQAYGYVATVGGTTDVITLTPSPAIIAYAAGQAFSFISSGANTGAVTVNVSGLGAKSLTKEGVNALAAGDIPSGALVRIQYDGTRFQLETRVVNPYADPLTTRGDIIYRDASATSRLALGTSGQVLKSDGTDAAWSDETPITTRGDVVRGDASGKAERLALGTSGQVLTSDGTDAAWADIPASVPLVNNVLAPHQGLVCKYVSATTADVDATMVILTDSSNNQYAAASVNLTLDITVSGANGLDTGTEANSTWYHLWVIYNGSTVAGLLSTSSTAPTLPSGYTYKGYVGAIYNNSSGNFNNIHQIGNRFVIPKTIVVNSGTASTYTALDLSSIVPSSATSVYGEGLIQDLSSPYNKHFLFIASTAAGLGEIRTRTLNTSNASGFPCPFPSILMTTQQTIFYRVQQDGGSGGAGDVYVSGGVF